LARANQEFECHLEEQAENVLNKYAENERLSRSDTIALHEVELQFATMLRYAMLPRFLGLLERTVKGLCMLADSEAYRSVGQHNWLEAHQRFLKERGIDLSPIQEEFESLKYLIALRDCIIHANGEIAMCKYPARVQAAIREIDTARQLEDGLLFLGDQVIPSAKSTMSGILLYLFDAFGHRLDVRRYF
jgi:hypothetical protein